MIKLKYINLQIVESKLPICSLEIEVKRKSNKVTIDTSPVISGTKFGRLASIKYKKHFFEVYIRSVKKDHDIIIMMNVKDKATITEFKGTDHTLRELSGYVNIFIHNTLRGAYD